MEETTPNLQLQEPASPEALVPALDLLPLWIGLVLLALVIVAIIIVRSRKKSAVTDPLARRRAAYAAAKKSLEEANEPNAREAAVRTSLILRRFLSDAVDDPSLFETHEEFVTRKDSLKNLSPSAKEAATESFSRLARLKYAPEVPTDDPSAVVADARQLLETLNGGFHP